VAFESASLATRLVVPELDRAAQGCRREPTAVGTEGERRDPAGVSRERANLSTRRDLPDANRLVLVARREPMLVRAEGRRIHAARITFEDARAAFEKLSAKAKELAAGQSGYHVYHCPMLNKDWVQTSNSVANPYGGKDMVSCGEIQK